MIDVRLKKKVALITGGSRGIGRAIAELFMKEGAEVVITSKNQKQLQQTSQEIGNSFFVVGDVRNENDVKNVIDKTIKKFGRIDILINNAALAKGRDRVPIVELDDDVFQRVLDVKALGTYLCTKAVLKVLIDQGEGGKIINIASGAGKRGFVKVIVE